MLDRPLIIGASVSADWNSLSPGKKLSLRYTPLHKILTFAQGGRKGEQTLKGLGIDDFEDRTIVIGLDLFFWDSTEAEIEKTKAALKSLMEIAAQNDLPLVLGDIPELLPGRQPARPQLNLAIHTMCKKYGHCRVMPFDELHKQLNRDGYLVVYGQHLTLSQLVPDGLHLSEIAGDYLADMLATLLASLPRES